MIVPTARFAFYVSGGARRLKAWLALPEARRLAAARRVGFVLTDNPDDADLEAACAAAGIACERFAPPPGDRRAADEALSGRLLERCEATRADWLVVFGGRILRGGLLERYAGRIVNFHPAVLPAFKGLRAIDRAREARAFLLGNAAHLVTAEVDGGPVILQQVVHHARAGDADALLDRQVPMLRQLLRWLEQDRLVVADGYATIVGADYAPGEFIPALDPDIAADASAS